MQEIQEFRRKFFDSDRRLTSIGSGAVGGKARGLAFINDVLSAEVTPRNFPDIEVSIPTFTVIRTDVFDAFLERNSLYELAYSDSPDDVIAHKFQKAGLPVEILGDLRALIEKVHTPLAIRSSSLLEDALYQPFAGIYATKMIPNNQPSPDIRFQKLMEAIKFVYASTFWKSAKDYIRATGRLPREEKMAVIIQEVVGQRFSDRFYPQVSGVARSYNFYAFGRARPEDGVVSLALGLGKTIVDGEKCWTYSPLYPNIAPPYGSADELINQTQTEFWAVNMGKPPSYDPIKETEYLVKPNLVDAELDGTLRYLVSTYDADSDRLLTGAGKGGPRVLTFGGLLSLREVPLNDVIKSLLSVSQEAMKAPVEIEFAITFNPHRIGFLQVRPMVVSGEEVMVTAQDFSEGDVLIASEKVLGNGTIGTIQDIVYVKPEQFKAECTPRVAADLEMINRKLLTAARPYLLIGFGRWGSSDPWLGIPVNWGQVCGAKVIVEATGERMNVELSQGSHFFHNLTSFKVFYFCVSLAAGRSINWDWLATQQKEEETEFVRHVILRIPLQVKVDGRSGRGIVRVMGNA